MASGHALDLAATTAALCLLVGRLRGAPQLRRLQISMLTVMEESGYGMPGQDLIVERHSQLEKRVLRALRDVMQYSTSLRYRLSTAPCPWTAPPLNGPSPRPQKLGQRRVSLGLQSTSQCRA